MTTWQEWAAAVLAGVKAPSSPTNVATLKGWSTHEKGYWPSIQWCNPLNTTRDWPGSRDSGAQPGPHDVQIYLNLTDGANATIRTLLDPVAGVLPNGYNAIVAELRSSDPASWWAAAARSQLDTWGTGQSWLSSVPLTGDVMAKIDDIYSMLQKGTTVAGSASAISRMTADIAAIKAGSGGAVDLAPVLAAIADVKALLAGIPVGTLAPAQAQQLQEAHDAIQRIEAAFKAA